MTLTFEVTPELARRVEEARQHGIDVDALVERSLANLPELATSTKPPAPDAENQALIDLLRAWREEDATDDPNELERRDAELAEFKANLNANRAQSGEEPVF
ncbi:MAG TPA: hypothetical protein VKU00_19550 [Chthonomonadaceae bacterium]|nr:hypothetical protein [Chthonomonadaceae bacterium]